MKKYCLFFNRSDFKTEFVQKSQPDLKCLVICAWGDQGAAGRDLEGKIIEISAYKPTSGKEV